jgi:hypothetical protein
VTTDILSHLPVLDYETAEKWLAGKAGVLQEAADTALESQNPVQETPEELLETLKELEAEAQEADAQRYRDLRAKLVSGVDKTVYDALAPLPPDIRFCAGDLVADDLQITCDCLIVAGNLKVRGLMQTVMEAEEGALIVLGDVEVGRYISHGAHTVICGNLSAGHVSTNSLNDMAFSVGGNVKAESFAEFGEYVEIHGRLEVGTLINWMNEINVHGEQKAEVIIDRDTDLAATRLRAELIKEGCDVDGDAYTYIEEDDYNECLKRNVSPFV